MKGDAVFAVTQRLVHDCAYLGTPIPQFFTRLGREPIPELDDDFIATDPWLDPGILYVHVRVPPEQAFATVDCDRSMEQLCVDLAEHVQELLVEGSMWGAAWPPCPVHGTHPLWPEVVEDVAAWTCSHPPGFSRPIGQLASDV